MNNDGFLKEVREARRQRNDIFKVLKGKGNKSVLGTLSFTNKAEIKALPYTQQLRIFTISKNN